MKKYIRIFVCISLSFVIFSPLHAAEKIWDKKEMKFATSKGKKAYHISVKKNEDSSYALFITRKSKILLDIKSIQGGKGDIEGTLVLQFTIPEHKKIKTLVIYQKEDKISCRLEYLKNVKGKLVE